MNNNRGAEQFPHILMPDGELLPIQLPPPRRAKKPEAFFMGFKDAFDAVAQDTTLKGADLRLVMYLAARTDYENWINFTPVQAAADLKIDRTNVHHSLRRLKDAGVLEKTEQTKDQRGGWRFANTFLWRGKVKNLHDERKRRLEAVTAKEPTT